MGCLYRAREGARGRVATPPPSPGGGVRVVGAGSRRVIKCPPAISAAAPRGGRGLLMRVGPGPALLVTAATALAERDPGSGRCRLTDSDVEMSGGSDGSLGYERASFSSVVGGRRGGDTHSVWGDRPRRDRPTWTAAAGVRIYAEVEPGTVIVERRGSERPLRVGTASLER